MILPTTSNPAVLVLALTLATTVLSAALVWVVRAISRRAGVLDSPGVAGQVKVRRSVPNTGGIAITLAFVLPLGVVLGLVSTAPQVLTGLAPALEPHLAGLRAQAPLGWVLLGCVLLLHILGVIDDRRPLGPFLKLGVMALPALVVALGSDTRLATFLDASAGGVWLSVALTVLWFIVVTNALNFMDNMDGLAAGVAAIATTALLAIALGQGQWFVAGTLGLLLGCLVGFLFFNRPPASIFMGDGGSLVIGFLLAFLSVRLTYATIGPGEAPWHALLTPLVILAVPLYDFTSVVLLRLSQGKSPFVGDLQHLSHRLVGRGLSRPLAVLTICCFAGVCGLLGVLLPRSGAGSAMVLGAAVVLLFVAIAIMEFAPARSRPEGDRP